MKEERTITFTDVEWRLMQTLWALETPTFGEIMKDVHDTGWSKQSVVSFLKRLEAKGAVRRDTSLKPSRYTACVRKDDAIERETGAILQKVYGGNPVLMVTSAVNSGKLSDEDIQSLIDLLKKGSASDT